MLVRCVRFNDQYVVSGSYDGTVRVWDFAHGTQLMELRGHTNRVFRLQFDDLKIVSSSQDDTIIVWDFAREAAENRARLSSFDELVEPAPLSLDPVDSGSPTIVTPAQAVGAAAAGAAGGGSPGGSRLLPGLGWVRKSDL